MNRLQNYILCGERQRIFVRICFAIGSHLVRTSRLAADRENKVVPILSSALTAEHFLVEPLAHGADGVHLAGHHGGNVLRRDAQLDEHADVVLHIGHRVEALQLSGETRIDAFQAVLHLLPFLVLHQLTSCHAPLQDSILVGGEEGVLHRLDGLSHLLRTVLPHFLNLPELKQEPLATATVHDVVRHGDDGDDGDSRKEPLDVAGLLTFTDREHVMTSVGEICADGLAFDDVADVGPPLV